METAHLPSPTHISFPKASPFLASSFIAVQIWIVIYFLLALWKKSFLSIAGEQKRENDTYTEIDEDVVKRGNHPTSYCPSIVLQMQCSLLPLISHYALFIGSLCRMSPAEGEITYVVNSRF